MIGIDTNILLRWILDIRDPDDSSDQIDRVENLIANSGEQFFVNHIVIAETIWVLRRKVQQKKTSIAEAVERILLSVNVTVHDVDVVRAALVSFVKYPGDFSDHLIGEINKLNGCRMTLTFDRAAAKSPLFSELQR
ncbi:type II toxin-antitoxin system VapC family toxin [Agrobacterium sp. a22-2]|uniref:PIN domain-containing protein n=1 Tax=Agrobacterium sp. a22-2 TaxID=2283840 RepID=UPI001446FCC2|nr:type II toxin-antitoxin system VapC family toxin [Agrobacterium sp. a22-2]NKN35722.1 type II toxin-antitoxin system VapC family toxin [Agrobacterium sp. a22-2]